MWTPNAASRNVVLVAGQGTGRPRGKTFLEQTAACVGALLAVVGPVQARAEVVGAWTVNETISPLTNAKTLTATTPSTSPVLNQINLPEAAQLVLRCREGTRAAYVAWPQVLSAPYRSALLALPQTMVFKKLDDGPITNEFWIVSDSGASAGGFDNLGAPKIMAALRGAKRLVVRLTGQIQQDAVFDLTGVDDVVARVEAACGGGRVAAISPALMESAPVSISATGKPEVLLQASGEALRRAGFTDVKVDATSSSAPLQPFKLTSKQADCGRVFGISYLADGRAQTKVAATITTEEGRLTAKLTISGIQKTGMGAPDRPLKCMSTGQLERALLAQAE